MLGMTRSCIYLNAISIYSINIFRQVNLSLCIVCLIHKMIYNSIHIGNVNWFLVFFLYGINQFYK